MWLLNYLCIYIHATIGNVFVTCTCKECHDDNQKHHRYCYLIEGLVRRHYHYPGATRWSVTSHSLMNPQNIGTIELFFSGLKCSNYFSWSKSISLSLYTVVCSSSVLCTITERKFRPMQLLFSTAVSCAITSHPWGHDCCCQCQHRWHCQHCGQKLTSKLICLDT